MDDVARHAGVSKTSVSRVLNNVPGSVAARTASRIWEAVTDLGYVPNAVAASLKHQRTRTIGLILTDLGNPFFAAVAAGVESTIQEAGYSLVVSNTANDATREAALVRVLLERQIDALLVATSAESDDHLRAAVERGVHVVLVDSHPMRLSLDLDRVMVDNHAGAYEAAKHLLDLGHRDIGVVGGRPGDSSSIGRIEGVGEALRHAGVDLRPEWIVEGDFTVATGYECATTLLMREPRPSALFVANNLMTVGAMRAIADLTLVVPRDLSLVGFDDMDWYPIANPPITAVGQPAYEIGVRAAERLLLRIRRERQPPPETILLSTKLVVRESTAPPNRRRPE